MARFNEAGAGCPGIQDRIMLKFASEYRLQ